MPGESIDCRGPKGSTNQALIQVVSTLEIHDFCWKDLVFHNHSSGYTKHQKPKKSGWFENLKWNSHWKIIIND